MKSIKSMRIKIGKLFSLHKMYTVLELKFASNLKLEKLTLFLELFICFIKLDEKITRKRMLNIWPRTKPGVEIGEGVGVLE
jgi:hypothetical protein